MIPNAKEKLEAMIAEPNHKVTIKQPIVIIDNYSDKVIKYNPELTFMSDDGIIPAIEEWLTTCPDYNPDLCDFFVADNFNAIIIDKTTEE